jgi:hypothetical protein
MPSGVAGPAGLGRTRLSGIPSGMSGGRLGKGLALRGKHVEADFRSLELDVGTAEDPFGGPLRGPVRILVDDIRSWLVSRRPSCA